MKKNIQDLIRYSTQLTLISSFVIGNIAIAQENQTAPAENQAVNAPPVAAPGAVNEVPALQNTAAPVQMEPMTQPEHKQSHRQENLEKRRAKKAAHKEARQARRAERKEKRQGKRAERKEARQKHRAERKEARKNRK